LNYYFVVVKIINNALFRLKMSPDDSLEQIFETLSKLYDLPVKQETWKKTAQGPFYFLELEHCGEWTKLLYADRVISADLYDCEDQGYLNYTVLSPYQSCQEAFLKSLPLDIAKNLRGELAASKKVQIDRCVVRINLDNFSEIEEFLGAHIEHY